MAGAPLAQTLDLGRAQAGNLRHQHAIVELLALAHERACEAELAVMLEGLLDEKSLPDPKALRAHFLPDARTFPDVTVATAPLDLYDDLAAIHQGDAA